MTEATRKMSIPAGDDRGLLDRALALCEAVVEDTASAPAARERLFSELDEILERASEALIEAILAHDRFIAIRERVHDVRAEYEYQRETVVAEDMVRANNDTAAQEFRSRDWYDKAVDFESNALAPWAPKRLVFVGAGPFPTSPFNYMNLNPETTVVCLEKSEEAAGLSRQVAKILGFDRLDVITADAHTYDAYEDFDCVMVGLVVGTSAEDKSRIVEHFLSAVPETSMLTFRSAVGSGRVIYPSVDLAQLEGLDYRVMPDPPHKSFTMILVDRGVDRGAAKADA